jgi:DNA-binding LacI/PurR family transcriptional regulator
MSSKESRRHKVATMKDVAARAGVSYQTVSRVVNESPHVKRETRARVAEAVGELRYRPNNAARHLVSRRSGIIGFIGSLTFHGPARIMVSVEQTAKRHGYNVMIVELPEVNAQEVRRAIDDLCARQVEGIVILIPPELEMDFIRDVCRDVPFIAIDVDLGLSLPAVLVDQDRGALLAIRHVARLGHRRIALICGPPGWRAARLRREGWLKALKREGLAPGPILEGDWSAQSGYQATQELIRHYRGEFSAVVAANDHMALGALSAFSEHGIAVPDEISVIGYDGLPESQFYQPPLSTIYQDFAALGEVGLEYLLETINHPGALARRYVLKPILIARKSTKEVANHGNRNSR